jgi:hypothetical protein
MTKISGSGSISQRHGSADPDPYQNVMDLQQCISGKIISDLDPIMPKSVGPGSALLTLSDKYKQQQRSYPVYTTLLSPYCTVSEGIRICRVPYIMEYRRLCVRYGSFLEQCCGAGAEITNCGSDSSFLFIKDLKKFY